MDSNRLLQSNAIQRRYSTDLGTMVRRLINAHIVGCSLLLGCSGQPSQPRFPLREPMQRDDDMQPFTPAPEEYVSPFAWDAANQTIFRPISRLLAVDPAGRATNVNSLDEVPDSSWFTNRLGRVTLTPSEVEQGSCSKRLDPNAQDGSWIVDKGKDNGANPGFRVNVPGVGKFMLKSDIVEEPERATGATAIATRIYHALGYFAPCDTVVYFRPSILALKPGLTVTNNQGVTRPFDDAALQRILKNASHRGNLVRMVASQWLEGKPLGPYTYDGLRADDPNDVIPHEDRRELRGARLVAAWLNHFDSREQNTMDVFVSPKENVSKPTPSTMAPSKGRGYVRHYIIDLGDCFGSVWEAEGISRRLGHSYLFDFPYLAEDFSTLGAIERPWERAQRIGGTFNYFSAVDFDPELWRGEYPNPAFGRMTEADGAWMARILAHFNDELVAAAVRVGAYTEPTARYLIQTLIQRRDAILRRYLARLSPIGHLHLEGDRLCGVDLARRAHVVPEEEATLRAGIASDKSVAPQHALPMDARGNGAFCVRLERSAAEGGIADDDASRYRRVAIFNGYARGPLVVHLYDLGERRGFRLVGAERLDRMPVPWQAQQ